MSEPLDPGIVAVCTAYATMRCEVRSLDRDGIGGEYMAALASAAHRLLCLAPGASGPYLDTIKRIMEIDTATTDPNVILMRASVLGANSQERLN